MRVLVVGSGGREHALCWSLARNNHKVWCAPGNPGTAQVGTNVPLAASDTLALANFARNYDIALVIPGSEVSLCAGITDAMNQDGIPCFGPTRHAAQLEASKAYTKFLCSGANIPTAAWQAFHDVQAAETYIKTAGGPLYIKANGLALGKGAVFAETERDAIAIVNDMMRHHSLGNAGSVVVIEEVLVGEELSFFALCNGTDAVPFGAARDYKRLAPALSSPNTGGMGAYTLPMMDIQDDVMERIILPTLHLMTKRGQPYTGVLYAGLMLTQDGPKLIEYNVRFGDPECQALALCYDEDLFDVFGETLAGKKPQPLAVRSAVSVVMAAPGYPEAPQTGSEIKAIDVPEDVLVFHAGTERTPGGRLIAAGGRVLNVCAAGPDRAAARSKVYAAMAGIDWPDGYYRQDVGE